GKCHDRGIRGNGNRLALSRPARLEWDQASGWLLGYRDGRAQDSKGGQRQADAIRAALHFLLLSSSGRSSGSSPGRPCRPRSSAFTCRPVTFRLCSFWRLAGSSRIRVLGGFFLISPSTALARALSRSGLLREIYSGGIAGGLAQPRGKRWPCVKQKSDRQLSGQLPSGPAWPGTTIGVKVSPSDWIRSRPPFSQS